MFQAASRGYPIVFLTGIFLLFGSGTGNTAAVPENIIFLNPATRAAILVDKENQRLHVYGNPGGQIKEVRQYPCSTGEVAGRKARSGDRKTPEGVYFITHDYEKRYLSPVYGSRALPLNYPDFLDRREGRSGSAIWLHGTNRKLRPMDSNGCVALENADIESLASEVDLFCTPVILLDRISFEDDARLRSEKKEIGRFLDSWKTALEADAPSSFLGHYDSAVLPDVSWWEAWRKAGRSVAGKNGSPVCHTTPLGYYRYQDVYVALFDFCLESGPFREPVGRRQLFLRKTDSGFHIVGDAYLKAGVRESSEEKPPIVAAAHALRRKIFADAEIRTMLALWLRAWSDKDIDSYAGHYASDFRSGKMDKNAWTRYKSGLNEKYAFIRVAASDISIVPHDRFFSVTFLQHYESSGHKATGEKRLVLVHENGGWKIRRELWKKRAQAARSHPGPQNSQR